MILEAIYNGDFYLSETFVPRVCFKTIKLTKAKCKQEKQRHENRQPSFHTW